MKLRSIVFALGMLSMNSVTAAEDWIGCGTSGGGSFPSTGNGVGTSCEAALAHAIDAAMGNPCDWCDVWTQCAREDAEIELDPEWDFSCGTRPCCPGVYFVTVSFGNSTFDATCGACPLW